MALVSLLSFTILSKCVAVQFLYRQKSETVLMLRMEDDLGRFTLLEMDINAGA